MKYEIVEASRGFFYLVRDGVAVAKVLNKAEADKLLVNLNA